MSVRLTFRPDLLPRTEVREAIYLRFVRVLEAIAAKTWNCL